MEQRNLSLVRDYALDRTTEVREYVGVGFRWRKRMAVVFTVTMLGAVGVAFSNWQYESQMKILVHRDRVDPVVTGGQTHPEVRPDFSEEELNSEIELLRSDDVLHKVVLALGLQRTTAEPIWYYLPQFRTVDSEDVRIAKAVMGLAKHLDISLPKKHAVITVRYQAGSPKLAAEVLTALSRFYLDKHASVHRPPGQSRFFEQQADRYRRELSNAEESLTRFSRAGGTVAGQVELDNAVKQLADARLAHRQTVTAIEETEKRITALQVQMNSTPSRMTTAVHTADNPHLMMQLKTTLLNLELRRSEMLKKFQPTYREVQELDRQIADTRAAIAAAENKPPRDETTDRDPTYEWLRSELAKAQAELTSLHARASSLAQTIAQNWAETRKIQASTFRQGDLAREAKALEDSYQLYLRKRDEARISDDLDRIKLLNVSILEKPSVPALPKRSPWVVLSAGLVGAVVLSVGTAILSEHLDDSLRTPGAIQQTLNVPVLAVLISERRLLNEGIERQ